MSAIILLIALLAVVNIEGEAPACKLDLTFIVDGSSTVCEGQPFESCPNWRENLLFIKNIVQDLTIGPDDSKVAFIKFGDAVDLRWNLNKYTDEASLLAAIDNETIPGGELHSTAGFSVVATDVYNETVGDRPDVPNVAVLFTDHANVTTEESGEDSAKLQEYAKLKMMLVCLTARCKERCAANMSSPPKQNGITYFVVQEYSLLENVRRNLEEHLCVFPRA